MRTSEHVVIANAKALIWDFDGTILEGEGEVCQVAGLMATEIGCSAPDMELVRANSFGSLPETLSALFGPVSAEELARRVARFQELQQDGYRNPAERLFDDALDLAERAATHGLAQIIVTNRMHEGNGLASPRSVVERTVLEGWITHIVCREDTKYPKPDRRVVEALLEEKGIDPQEAVVIGDQWIDAELARELGGYAILVCRDADEVPNMHRLPKSWQDYTTVVSSLRQVHFGFASIPLQLAGEIPSEIPETSAPTTTRGGVPSQRAVPGRLQSSEA